jgi:hypothetical protein
LKNLTLDLEQAGLYLCKQIINHSMAQRVTKKQLRVQIKQTLLTTFDELKSDLSDKKFQRNVRRASKVLLAGLSVKKVAKKTKTNVEESVAA